MQRFHPGHKFSAKQRTTDVLTDEQVDFESLLLSPLLLKGLSDSGFEKPSPIQLKAIPLGRCGLDLIAQAKSGTGKTCVFSVIALENVQIECPATQVLVLAPTREIAVQIKDVVNAIGCHMKGLNCQVFIGGLPLDDDKKALKGCHIAVGSPGRIKNLIENKYLKTDSVRMFILDEADKLLDESFQEQINWIFSTLPANKQMMAFSATYPEYLANHLTRYMREPTFVRLNAADPTLQGIKQFYHVVPFHQLPHKIFQEKVEQLLKLLSKVNFHQCLLFSNYQIRAQSLSSTLCAKGWPATFIAGSQTQQKRLQAMEKLKEFKCRILISTDLTARGIDAENVNLVVNMDVPRDGETYLHRIGRAGRFGTKGVAVTFVAKGKEEKCLREIEKSIVITMEALPDEIPESMMISKSLPEHGHEQMKQDTVEVSVLHRATSTTKNHKEILTSREEKDNRFALKESKDHYKQNLLELNTLTNECEDSFVHENEISKIQNVNLSTNSSGTVTDGYETKIVAPSKKPVENDLDDHEPVTYGLKKDYFARNQEKVMGIPSVEEFEKDFEEYLAMASTFEDFGLQEKSKNINNFGDRDNLNGYENEGKKGTYTMGNASGENVIRQKDDGGCKVSVRSDENTSFGGNNNSGGADEDDDDSIDYCTGEGEDSGEDEGSDSVNEDDFDNEIRGDDDSSGDCDGGKNDGNDYDDDDDDSIINGSDEEVCGEDVSKLVDNQHNSFSIHNGASFEIEPKKGLEIKECQSSTENQSGKSISSVIFKRSIKDNNFNDTEIINMEENLEGDYNDNDDFEDDDYDYGDGDDDVEESKVESSTHDHKSSNYNYGITSSTTAKYYGDYNATEFKQNPKHLNTHKPEYVPHSLYNNPGMMPHQQAMHCNPTFIPDQYSYVGMCDSSISNNYMSYKTGTCCYPPSFPPVESYNQHLDCNSINFHQQPVQDHQGLRSPMNGASIVQNSDACWNSSTWHNTFHKINNAIQNFAALNSQKYNFS